MYYFDSLEQSNEFLRLALSELGKYGIPPDPMNYAVWYEYVSGKNANLTAAIDQLVKGSGKTLDDEMSRDLYDQYIADEKRLVLDAIRSEIRNILDRVLGDIAETDGDMSRSESSLESYIEDIQKALDAKTVQRIIDSVLSQVKLIGKSGNQLRENLETVSHEVEGLKKKLEKLSEEARTDTLTGLANRRAFEDAIVREMDRSNRSGSELSLLLADIDHFKRINDTHGHLVGDNVLRITAKMIKGKIRGQDLVARFGGEEFVIMLPDTPLEGAAVVAEKIRASFEKMQVKKKQSQETIGVITLSLGGASYRKGESLEELIGRTDSALYQSKGKGRNRVTCVDMR
jgi:diguanylate cyclase